MTSLTRFAVASVVLLVGAVATACGGDGGGAPADASKDDFCEAQTSFLTDLDLDPEAGLPPEKELAEAVRGWGRRIEEVGTPENIPAAAREGFEELVAAAKDVSEADLAAPDPEVLEGTMSEKARDQVEVFTTYVDETCGSIFGDLDLPELE